MRVVVGMHINSDKCCLLRQKEGLCENYSIFRELSLLQYKPIPCGLRKSLLFLGRECGRKREMYKFNTIIF